MVHSKCVAKEGAIGPNGVNACISRASDSAGVSAWTYHPTKNRLDSLINLLTGGREVVWRWGRKAIPVQLDEEFGIGATELVSWDWTIANGTIVRAARYVLSQRVRPPRSWLLHPGHCHPDDSGMGQWLSRHSRVLPGKKKRQDGFFEPEP